MTEAQQPTSEQVPGPRAKLIRWGPLCRGGVHRGPQQLSRGRAQAGQGLQVTVPQAVPGLATQRQGLPKGLRKV